MSLERIPVARSLIDSLDRVLDKGIVFEAWLRIAGTGIDLVASRSRIVLSSVETPIAGPAAVVRLPRWKHSMAVLRRFG